MENLGIYETYMYFGRISGIGKIYAPGTPSKWGGYFTAYPKFDRSPDTLNVFSMLLDN
jgi:hypothetical protein